MQPEILGTEQRLCRICCDVTSHLKVEIDGIIMYACQKIHHPGLDAYLRKCLNANVKRGDPPSKPAG